MDLSAHSGEYTAEYNHRVQSERNLPDGERLSIVMAVILLAYAVSRFVQTPGRTLALELAGVYLPLQLNINAAIAVIVAGLTAAGTDWLLLESRPSGRSRYRHWLLPAMTAWVFSLLLASLPFNAEWWLALAFCAGVVLAVIVAEYASSSNGNTYNAFATQALSLLTFGLFLVLAIIVRAVGLRLYLALPAVGLGLLMAGSRLQLLRAGRRWQPFQVVGLAFVGVQIAAALHYLPISALGYGLALLGLLFALHRYTMAINEQDLSIQPIREATLAVALFWILAIIIG